TEVVGREAADREDAGIVHFRHYGINQDDKLCVQTERKALIKRKSHWGEK
ncbi:MAG TPA: acyl dehydratase, partial [Cupriavidus sp.]|nr:acyl dehydratase [Cupriavidus sp.]